MHFWAMDESIAIVNHELGISKRTIVDWLNFFREICSQYVAQQNTPIGGPGKTVEIDESVFLLYPDSKLYQNDMFLFDFFSDRVFQKWILTHLNVFQHCG